MDVLPKIKHFIEKERLLNAGDRILIAVSGGADSIYLMHVLHQLAPAMDLRLFVGHVHHQLRGKESDEDEAFVRNSAEDLGLPFRSVRVDVHSTMKTFGESLQPAARRLRYQALAQIAEEWNISLIATAHHADDQAETLVQRFIRGSSLEGLSGIAAKRDWPFREYASTPFLIRPLLSVRRAEIEQELARFNLSYRNDSSNASTKYFRNKIRLQLLPLLVEKYNPGLIETLNTAAGIYKEENRYLEEQAAAAYWEVVQQTEGGICLDRSRFIRLPVALQRRVIKLILYYLEQGYNRWNFTHIEDVREIAVQATPHAEYHLPKGLLVKRKYEELHILQANFQPQDSHSAESDWVKVQVPGITYISSLGLQLKTELIEDPPSSRDQMVPSGEVWFDYGGLSGKPLYIRSRRPGDRLRLFGMEGSKKVKDLFIEKKIPMDRRDSWPLLTDGEQILWVVGLRRSDAYPLTDKSTPALRVQVFCSDELPV